MDGLLIALAVCILIYLLYRLVIFFIGYGLILLAKEMSEVDRETFINLLKKYCK